MSVPYKIHIEAPLTEWNLDRRDICKIFNISVNTLCSWIDLKKFPEPFIWVGKSPRWRLKGLNNFMASSEDMEGSIIVHKPIILKNGKESRGEFILIPRKN